MCVCVSDFFNLNLQTYPNRTSAWHKICGKTELNSKMKFHDSDSLCLKILSLPSLDALPNPAVLPRRSQSHSRRLPRRDCETSAPQSCWRRFLRVWWDNTARSKSVIARSCLFVCLCLPLWRIYKNVYMRTNIFRAQVIHVVRVFVMDIWLKRTKYFSFVAFSLWDSLL